MWPLSVRMQGRATGVAIPHQISTQHDSEASAEQCLEVMGRWGFIICTLHQICLGRQEDNIGERCNTIERDKQSDILDVNLGGVNFSLYIPL